jgi:TonB-linked SusC/RagA family outer membrane protein
MKEMKRIKKMRILSSYILCLMAVFMMQGRLVSVSAQNVIPDGKQYFVSGTVNDAATGKPLPGININVTGISSAITKDDGTYTIKVPSGNAILVIDDNSYARRDIPVRGRDTVNIVLYDKGYKGAQRNVYTPVGEKSSTNIANAWSSVSEDNILSTAVTPEALLQGYVSGVNTIYSSGMPGSAANIFMRGFNTLHGGSMPLFVVDGIPYENTAYAESLIGNYRANPLASIDIKDIESITVMKDGTSFYGVKGANGVILINTIKSNHLETRINAHVHTGISFEPEEYAILNASQHKNLVSDIYQSMGYSPTETAKLPFFDKTIPVEQAWGYEGNKDYYRYNHNTDWQDVIYDSKMNQDYYINVSGGDNMALYMLSLGYLDQQGTLNNTHFQRFNTRFNAEINFSTKVKFHANMSFAYGNKKLANEGPDYAKNPILSSLLKTPAMVSNIYTATGKMSPLYEDVDLFGNSNPYVLVNELSLDNSNYRFLGSFKMDWQPTRKLGISGLIGVNFNKEREKMFYPSVGVYFAPQDITQITNESQHRVDRLFSLYTDAYLHYSNKFGTNHHLNLRAGLRYQNNKAENDYGESFNSPSDDFKSLQYGVALLRRIGGSLGSWNWMSAYANADYNMSNKYFFNFSIASDASSRYGQNAPTMLTYPSLAGAWLLSGEEFLKGVSALDLLKLRVSYGLSGNDNIGNYNGVQYYVPQSILGAYGLIRGNLVNLNLKPEQIETLNAGLDVSVLNERISLSVDVYRNTVRDMILQTAPPRQTGFTGYINNAGSMRNRGVDLNINSRILNKEFKWDFGVTVSHYKNEVLDLGDKEELYTEAIDAVIQTKKGQPLGQFYGYKTSGVYSTAADAAKDGLYIRQGLVDVPFAEGDIRFVNLSGGDKLIDENDRTVIGDPNPDIFGSISNKFKYKQWSLNTLLTYSLGNDVYNYTRSQMENLSTFNNQSKTVLNRWRHEGDATDMPKIAYGDPMGNARFSDRWIEDGSYIRLKSATLSYDLDIKRDFIQGCTIFISSENLFTLTRYKGSDPEFVLGQSPLFYGIDACTVPQPRTVSIGVKLSL